MANDLLEGIESVSTMAELNAWLAGRPDRVAWLSEYAGLKKGKKAHDTDVSAVVETELPIGEGPAVFASMKADDSASAMRLARVQEKSTGARTDVLHVRVRVSAWATDESGNVLYEDGLPIAAEYAPVYKRAQFYRHDGSRPRIRDEYWTDSRGIILPEVEQEALSFKYPHAVVGLTPDEREEYEHTGEAKRVFIENGAEWWYRRHSILGTDPNRVVSDPMAVIRVIIERDEARIRRRQEAIDLATRKPEDPAPAEVPPVVEEKPEPKKRPKTREERKAAARQRKLDRMYRVMTGEQARLSAELAKLCEKRDALIEELSEYSLQRKVARKMHNDAKNSGLGAYVFTDQGPVPAFGDDCLSPYRGLKLDLNEEYTFRKEELDEIEARLSKLRRAML